MNKKWAVPFLFSVSADAILTYSYMGNNWFPILFIGFFCDALLSIVFIGLYAACRAIRDFRSKPLPKWAALFALSPIVLIVYIFYGGLRVVTIDRFLSRGVVVSISILGFIIFWHGVRGCFRQLRREKNKSKPFKNKREVVLPLEIEVNRPAIVETKEEKLLKSEEGKPKANSIGKKEVDFSETDYINQVNGLIHIMLETCPITAQAAVDKFMTNKRALGYLFGVHDYLSRRTNLINKETTEEFVISIQLSYSNIFGDKSGEALFNATCSFLSDETFKNGQKIGVAESARYLEKGELPTSFYLLLMLGR
jgi:hypothetical protein